MLKHWSPTLLLLLIMSTTTSRMLLVDLKVLKHFLLDGPINIYLLIASNLHGMIIFYSHPYKKNGLIFFIHFLWVKLLVRPEFPMKCYVKLVHIFLPHYGNL